MLRVLQEAKIDLPKLLENSQAWNSLLIDYSLPVIERLWLPYGEGRIYLHRSHPCKEGQSLFHPHNWPAAMSVESASYEMIIGFGQGELPPPPMGKIVLAAGSEYDMTHPDAWHSIRPLGKSPTYSLMVTGRPWNRPAPKSDHTLKGLTRSQRMVILDFFWRRYGTK